jgi:exopolysaccharide biosynthesis polyprenyl glycosylphosphotransferase
MQKKLRAKKIIKIPVLVVGSYDKVLQFNKKIKNSINWGYESKGSVLISKREYDKINEENSLEKFEDINKLIDKTNPDVIIISTERPNHEKLMRIVEIARIRNIRVKIEPDLYDIFTGRTKTQFLYGIPLIEISTQLLKPWQATIKRLFDIVFSALVILIGLPIWLLVGIIIKLESSGPAFFIQERVGRNGVPFKIYKYRSMCVNKGGNWTSVNDPRVTKFGKFIRKTHLDEIPQFINVFIGDMSVVGPRPEQLKFVLQFEEEVPHYQRRHLVRPGITGWWQVKYSNYEFSIDEIKNRLKDDFYYIENMSLKLDFEIVIRTVWLVLTGHGQA